MASPTGEERKSLEYWLNRATDPDADAAVLGGYITSFVEQLNDELEGPQIACRLLTHKIQSPQEQEALYALEVLESCVKNCGQRFHNEIGKFRFLNELIKILSPKYLGSKTGEKVRTRTIELMYSWNKTLKHQPKLKQAYDMLKHQGIIQHDPTYMDEIYEQPVVQERARQATFEDEEKAKLLAALLKSQNPDDLQAANRMIKSMVREEERKHEMLAKRISDLKTMQNNARLLNEMLAQYSAATVSGQELEIMKELHGSLQSQRPTLFRYATEANENDEAILAEVLSVNDDVGKAIDDYRLKVSQNPPLGKDGSLLSLDDSSHQHGAPCDTNSSLLLNGTQAACLISSDMPSSSSLLIDDVMLLGGLGTPLVQRKGTSPSSLNTTNPLGDLTELYSGKISSGGGGACLPASTAMNYASSTASSSRRVSAENMIGTSQSVRSPIDAPSVDQRTSTPPEELQECPAGTNPMAAAYLSAQASKASATPVQEPSAAKPKGLLDLDVLSQTLIQEHLPTGTNSASQFTKECKPKRALRDIPSTFIAPPSMSPLDPFGPHSRVSSNEGNEPADTAALGATPANSSSSVSSNSPVITNNSTLAGPGSDSSSLSTLDKLKQLQDTCNDKIKQSTTRHGGVVNDSIAQPQSKMELGDAKLDGSPRQLPETQLPVLSTEEPVDKDAKIYIPMTSSSKSIPSAAGDSQTGVVPPPALFSRDASPLCESQPNVLPTRPPPPTLKEHSSKTSSTSSEASNQPPDIDAYSIALEDIEPGDKDSVVVFDQDNLLIHFHYASNQLAPHVHTTVVSIMSKLKQKITNVSFDVRPNPSSALSLRLLSPSSTALPAHNPIFPQQTISQILLLGTAYKSLPTPVEINYTMGYTLAGTIRTVQGSFNLDLS